MVSQIFMVVQQLTHIPFIYYISKEQLLMAYDEYLNSSISRMIERVIFENGDPRFFLAELKHSNKFSSNDMLEKYEGYVFIHRLPHMRLPKKVLRRINYGLYSLFAIFVFLSSI